VACLILIRHYFNNKENKSSIKELIYTTKEKDNDSDRENVLFDRLVLELINNCKKNIKKEDADKVR
jgi:hypothetical protein